MADSYSKKEREKKRQKRKKDKAARKEANKLDKPKSIEFMYLDADGNLSPEKPDPDQKKKIKLEDIQISVQKQEKSDESQFQKYGFVKFFNTEKGYGFLVDKATNDSYFVHIDQLKEPVGDGDKVSFQTGKGPKGPIAIDVKKIDAYPS